MRIRLPPKRIKFREDHFMYKEVWDAIIDNTVNVHSTCKTESFPYCNRKRRLKKNVYCYPFCTDMSILLSSKRSIDSIKEDTSKEDTCIQLCSL